MVLWYERVFLRLASSAKSNERTGGRFEQQNIDNSKTENEGGDCMHFRNQGVAGNYPNRAIPLMLALGNHQSHCSHAARPQG